MRRTSTDPTFLMPPFRPTARQHEAIGRIVVVYTILETCLERILARLVMAPDFPALALTSDLGPDNRVGALKALIALHRQRYRYHRVPKDVLDDLAALIPTLLTLKTERNTITHRVWMRQSDEKMLGVRFRAKLPSTIPSEIAASESQPTLASLKTLADEIQDVADQLYVLCQLLPAVSEAQSAGLPERTQPPPRS